VHGTKTTKIVSIENVRNDHALMDIEKYLNFGDDPVTRI
jgi:hypothetical protein